MRYKILFFINFRASIIEGTPYNARFAEGVVFLWFPI